ncbi:MAG: transporter [Tardiphaga sp.]|jgi:MFS family permease|nr:transporter [Tardiphaga sp.]
MTSSPDAKPLGRGGLYLLLAGQLLPMVDFSIVNVAMDSMAHSLGASETQLVLIVAVYGVAFALCLAMGGRLGDNFGRRRLFGSGVALFAVASLLCGLATSVPQLLVARAIQGVGAALVVPQILATIHVTLRGHAHSRAIGLYASVNGLAFVVGQVFGGFLVSADIGGLAWRNVFLVNLPICLAILVWMRRFLPETRSPNPARIDWPGTLMLALVVLCLLLPLSLGPLLHWPWQGTVILLVVPLLCWLLWRVELRQEARSAAPLLPPSLLRLRSVRYGLAMMAIFFGSFSGYMFAMALTLQIGAGFSALQSGNAFIAVGTAFFVGSLLTARAFARFERSTVLLFGCAVQMTGLLLLMLTLYAVWPQPSVFHLIPATFLVGFGQAFMVGSFFRISLSELPPGQAGAGSAMLSTVQQASFGLGPAVFGAVLTQVLHIEAGNYLHAELAALGVEVCLMAVLAGVALSLRRGAPAAVVVIQG